MKYIGMPMGMWLLFHRSFREEMVGVLGFSESAATETEKKALPKYKEIIAGLPEFEKADRFKMNIVNCAMLAAFYLNMQRKPTLEQMTEYYKVDSLEDYDSMVRAVGFFTFKYGKIDWIESNNEFKANINSFDRFCF